MPSESGSEGDGWREEGDRFEDYAEELQKRYGEADESEEPEQSEGAELPNQSGAQAEFEAYLRELEAKYGEKDGGVDQSQGSENEHSAELAVPEGQSDAEKVHDGNEGVGVRKTEGQTETAESAEAEEEWGKEKAEDYSQNPRASRDVDKDGDDDLIGSSGENVDCSANASASERQDASKEAAGDDDGGGREPEARSAQANEAEPSTDGTDTPNTTGQRTETGDSDSDLDQPEGKSTSGDENDITVPASPEVEEPQEGSQDVQVAVEEQTERIPSQAKWFEEQAVGRQNGTHDQTMPEKEPRAKPDIGAYQINPDHEWLEGEKDLLRLGKDSSASPPDEMKDPPIG